MLATLALCAAAGVGLYNDQRDTLRHAYSNGDGKSASRVDLAVAIRRADVTNGQLVLSVMPNPVGRLALANDAGTPTRRLVIGRALPLPRSCPLLGVSPSLSERS